MTAELADDFAEEEAPIAEVSLSPSARFMLNEVARRPGRTAAQLQKTLRRSPVTIRRMGAHLRGLGLLFTLNPTWVVLRPGGKAVWEDRRRYLTPGRTALAAADIMVHLLAEGGVDTKARLFAAVGREKAGQEKHTTSSMVHALSQLRADYVLWPWDAFVLTALGERVARGCEFTVAEQRGAV